MMAEMSMPAVWKNIIVAAAMTMKRGVPIRAKISVRIRRRIMRVFP